MNLVETLADGIGVRTAGSDEAGQAAEAVAGALREGGLEPRFQEFWLLGYDADEPVVEVDGERIDAGPCMYAHPTDGTAAGTLRHIGVFKLGFFPEADIFAIEDADGRELARLQTSPFGGAAIPFLAGPRQIVVGPTAFISGADARLLRERDGVPARARIGGRFVPGRRDRNVVAEPRGESEEAIVVSSHYDSVWRGPGGIDNATGVEGMRRVAERLAGRTLPRTVIFCSFAAEEIGLIGSWHFVYEAKLRGEFERIKGVVNPDCIAHGELLQLHASPGELRGRLQARAEALGLTERCEVRVGPTAPGVDAFPFSVEGVPALTILNFPYPEYHLPTDVSGLVDEQRLEDAVELAVALVESQLERPIENS